MVLEVSLSYASAFMSPLLINDSILFVCVHACKILDLYPNNAYLFINILWLAYTCSRSMHCIEERVVANRSVVERLT